MKKWLSLFLLSCFHVSYAHSFMQDEANELTARLNTIIMLTHSSSSNYKKAESLWQSFSNKSQKFLKRHGGKDLFLRQASPKERSKGMSDIFLPLEAYTRNCLYNALKKGNVFCLKKLCELQKDGLIFIENFLKCCRRCNHSDKIQLRYIHRCLRKAVRKKAFLEENFLENLVQTLFENVEVQHNVMFTLLKRQNCALKNACNIFFQSYKSIDSLYKLITDLYISWNKRDGNLVVAVKYKLFLDVIKKLHFYHQMIVKINNKNHLKLLQEEKKRLQEFIHFFEKAIEAQSGFIPYPYLQNSMSKVKKITSKDDLVNLRTSLNFTLPLFIAQKIYYPGILKYRYNDSHIYFLIKNFSSNKLKKIDLFIQRQSQKLKKHILAL